MNDHEEMSGGPNPVLIVVLRSRLTMALNGERPAACFRAAGTRFQSSGLGDWTGFHDWLRNERGLLLGVRLTPTSWDIPEGLSVLEYVRVIEQRAIEIYFFEDRDVAAERSRDQAFQYNAVFQEANGYALAFDTEDLTKQDLDRVMQCGCETVTLSSC